MRRPPNVKPPSVAARPGGPSRRKIAFDVVVCLVVVPLAIFLVMGWLGDVARFAERVESDPEALTAWCDWEGPLAGPFCECIKRGGAR